MTEFEIQRGNRKTGRTLVAVNMGEGYESFDEPRLAAGLLQERFLELTKQLAFTKSAGGAIESVPSFETLKTLRLELAWLQGDKRMIRSLING